MKLPRHLAIIMDGNGRWAQARGHHRVFGHVRGAAVARATIEECSRLGIKNLTLFTFSTENWQRPSDEVSFLMSLLFRRLKRETPTLIRNNIKFHYIGDFARLPAMVQTVVRDAVASTAQCTGMNLTFALSYGGRQELTSAVRQIAARVQSGELNATDVDEALIGSTLESSYLPDPDLIVRTSGEHRLSNFFLWQAAYSEIYVTDRPWPEFSKAELIRAIEIFNQRERRFGLTREQVAAQTVGPI